MKPTPYLFVYGTLKRGSQVAARKRLDDSAHFIKEAVLQANLFHLDEYPGAVLSENAKDQIHGELYELKDPEGIFSELDTYEDAQAGGEFTRQLVYVTFPEYGFPLECWAYLYQGSLHNRLKVPGGRFLV